MAFNQYQSCGGDIKAEPQHGGQQQDGGERREIQWFGAIDGDHYNHHP